jgi:hypothetical protein
VGTVAASARRRSRPLRAGRYEHGGGGIRWTLSPRATNRQRGRSHARATAPRPLTLDLRRRRDARGDPDSSLRATITHHAFPAQRGIDAVSSRWPDSSLGATLESSSGIGSQPSQSGSCATRILGRASRCPRRTSSFPCSSSIGSSRSGRGRRPPPSSRSSSERTPVPHTRRLLRFVPCGRIAPDLDGARIRERAGAGLTDAPLRAGDDQVAARRAGDRDDDAAVDDGRQVNAHARGRRCGPSRVRTRRPRERRPRDPRPERWASLAGVTDVVARLASVCRACSRCRGLPGWSR